MSEKKTTNEYIVSVEGHGEIHVREEATGNQDARQNTFQVELLKFGIKDGTDWIPPHRILRVQRRDVA